jgi:hypothetical protein
MSVAVCIAAIWSASHVIAAPLDETDILQLANAARHEGESRRDNPEQARNSYLEAASGYESLIQLGIHNAALFRNEGNAYFLAGDLPRAILAYRRGLRMAPADAVLQADLRYAREQVDYPATDGFGRLRVDDWPPWVPRPTISAMLLMTLAGYTTGLLAVTRWCMTRRAYLLVVGVSLIGLTLFPLVGTIHEVWQQRRDKQMPLVVIAANRVPLRNGDGVSYPARYDGKTVNRGVEARLLFERGNWLHIELSGGETGWVRRSEVLIDSP